MPRFAHTFSYFYFRQFFRSVSNRFARKHLSICNSIRRYVGKIFSCIYIYIYTDISGTYLICITRKRVRRVSRRRISKNETRIPATMRLNNSFGAKESTRFRCLSLDITVSIFFSFPLSLSFLFFFPPLTWKPDSVWTRNNSSCSLVFTFGTFSTRRDV